MALETRTTSNTTYLQLDFGKKAMYIYSKEEKDGFEKYTSSKGNVSYRKYVTAVSGYIVNAYFREGNFNDEFVLVFEDEGERFSIQIGITDSIFSSLARSILNIDVSKRVRFSVYESRGEGDKTYFGLSLTYPEQLDKDGKAEFVEWGDELPKGKQLRNGKWDFSEANDEAYGRVEEFIKNNNFENSYKSDNVEKEEEKETTKKEEKSSKKTKSVEVEEDDLPF